MHLIILKDFHRTAPLLEICSHTLPNQLCPIAYDLISICSLMCSFIAAFSPDPFFPNSTVQCFSTMAQVQVKTTLKRKLKQSAPTTSTTATAQHANISQTLEFAQQQSFKVVHTVLHSSVSLSSLLLYRSATLNFHFLASIPRLPPVTSLLIAHRRLRI